MASETAPSPSPDVALEAAFAAKREWHVAQAALSPKEKIAELLVMQKAVLPILRRRRPLAPHERPWPIRP